MTALIDEVTRGYGNAKTRVRDVAELTDLFERSRRDHPRLLGEADVLAWAGQRPREQHEAQPALAGLHVLALVRTNW